MRPVALLQHDATQRPGYLLECLDGLGVPCVTLCPDEHDPVPRQATDFSGIVLLGSEHSVHDPLPWIQAEQALVRDALAHDVPLLGHCFGAQLMALTLGAPVRRHAWPDIGWRRLKATPHAQTLFTPEQDIVAFNWHHDTFGIPQGAQRTLFGTHCLNKGFRLGPHLAFQCHFEVTADIVRDWCAHGRHELAACACPSVQAHDDILAQLPHALPRLRATAQRVYQTWASRLPGAPCLPPQTAPTDGPRRGLVQIDAVFMRHGPHCAGPLHRVDAFIDAPRRTTP